MYEFMTPHNGENRWGRYFDKKPAIPLNNGGIPFRFSYKDMRDLNEDMVPNLEYRKKTVLIETTCDMNWSPESYVSIDGELFKVMDISSVPLENNNTSLLRTVKKRFTIPLLRVNNPLEV